ncbi:MAG: hypothetical protein A2Z25_01630 [Planctomycetes bacterium RBG_16_55_9]|nr:MAG: hypothetical protein A2Z25_01630 [Planctomycetes bacterium RBG_16_55_9]
MRTTGEIREAPNDSNIDDAKKLCLNPPHRISKNGDSVGLGHVFTLPIPGEPTVMQRYIWRKKPLQLASITSGKNGILKKIVKFLHNIVR